jgi:hypothetical protein
MVNARGNMSMMMKLATWQQFSLESVEAHVERRNEERERKSAMREAPCETQSAGDWPLSTYSTVQYSTDSIQRSRQDAAECLAHR